MSSWILTLNKSIIPNDFKEGIIEFAPTYKYVNKTDDFDTRKRNPAWWDRVLYKWRNENLTQASYDSNNNIKISDHRPVFSQFEIKFDFDMNTVDKHDLIDLKKFASTKMKDEIEELIKSTKLREKELGKNKSKAWVIF